uniref:RWD domain-containing protein n=1 Tax=Chinchilla lanigera TaxID=34839 RepID=A0A8C2W5V1_CHILA
YLDSFTVLSENPRSFTIPVTTEAGENDEIVQTTLKCTYSEKYPDEAPLHDIFSQENLEDDGVTDILKLSTLQAEENLSVVMIFTVVTAVQEKLSEMVEQIKKRREEEKKLKEKEAEKQLFHGTLVTIEDFLCWEAQFDADLLEIKKKRMKEEEQAGKNKLSSKQLSETDHNLDTSDLQLLEDAGNSVEVDESLFQEMGDVELEDVEDEPDHNPADAGSGSTEGQTVSISREARQPQCVVAMLRGFNFLFFVVLRQGLAMQLRRA